MVQFDKEVQSFGLFFDTSSLLIAGEEIFEDYDFIVSSLTLKELEYIKTATNKDADVKYAARLLLRLFDKYPERYHVAQHQPGFERMYIETNHFAVNNDSRILSDALRWRDTCAFRNEYLYFVTNDLSLSSIAKADCFFGEDNVLKVVEEHDNYLGYKELTPSDEQLEEFYSEPKRNIFDLSIGEYFILRNPEGQVVDMGAWTGEENRHLKYSDLNSNWFGKMKPLDIYQRLVLDSLNTNQLTMIKGPAGSGKTILSLAFLMQQLERGEIHKIVIFCNTIATANSAKLGFYPGTRDEKLLDSQIGNLLISKFGGREGVERLINEDKLVLLPFSDIRGYDTTGMKAGIYISEAQNLDRSLMKLALQRIGSDCVCIIDGDIKSQVDDVHFEGCNNGMRRVSKVYRGSPIYGEVTLQTIHRSEIARIAENI